MFRGKSLVCYVPLPALTFALVRTASGEPAGFLPFANLSESPKLSHHGAAHYKTVAMVTVTAAGLPLAHLIFLDSFFMEPQCEIMLALIHDIFLRLYNVSFF